MKGSTIITMLSVAIGIVIGLRYILSDNLNKKKKNNQGGTKNGNE